MQIELILNGKSIARDVSPDTMLVDFLRAEGCYSVKRGCDTSNCGLCTVWINNTPQLSCGVLAARCKGKNITTLEGVQDEAKEFAEFMAAEGAEQCGFCSPGLVMTVLAMVRELKNPTEKEVNSYLSGNLCRCTGYMAQTRGILSYLKWRRGER